MSGDVALNELVMRVRRMMRTSAKRTVLFIRYSRFAFIRDDPRQRLVRMNGVKELAAHYGAECLIVGGLDAVVTFPDGKAVPVEMLPFLRLEAFGADYDKISAGREHFALFADTGIVWALRRLGRNAILRVSANGVSVGQALGVGLFQEDATEDRWMVA